VGGGTRLKVFEAMAVGCPMVSTAIGVEGLPVEHNRHYWRADTAQEFADAVSGLLAQRAVAERLSRDARAFVEARFSFWAVAKQFESICADAASLPQLDVARAVPEVIADHA
jgi:glycosyltransferase involved in cell wall biosynthesis